VYVNGQITLSGWSDFGVAIAAIDRPAVGRFERHLGLFAALGAYRREHLALGSVAGAAASGAFSLPCLPACGTSLGVIGIAPGPKRLLLVSGERELGPAIGALDGFVLKTHWMTSFSRI
jgi:hypothetical protein